MTTRALILVMAAARGKLARPQLQDGLNEGVCVACEEWTAKGLRASGQARSAS